MPAWSGLRGWRSRKARWGCVKSKRGLGLNMANNPKKVKDPTEVALSAIQEALNISDDSCGTSRDRASRAARSRRRSVLRSADLRRTDVRHAPAAHRAAECSIRSRSRARSRRAANDDRETIGQMLQAIQKGRPARSVYTLATLFAGVWLIGCALLTVSFLPSLQAAIGQGRRRAGASPALPRCSSRRCCCSTSWPAWPGAARKCA